jgi:hypothetical protein
MAILLFKHYLKISNFENTGSPPLTLFLGTEKNRALGGLFSTTVKLGNKERFDKEQIGIKEPFPVTNLPFTS